MQDVWDDVVDEILNEKKENKDVLKCTIQVLFEALLVTCKKTWFCVVRTLPVEAKIMPQKWWRNQEQGI